MKQGEASNTKKLFKVPIESRVRVYEDIVSRVLSLIQTGKLKVSDKLPPERELAEMLQVSRSSVREALRSLELLGHIEIRSGAEGGSYVKEVGLENAQLILQSMFNLNQKSVTDIIEVRMIIEVQSVVIATKRCNDDDIEELEKTIKLMETEIRNGDIGIIGDHQFHCALARATHNQFLSQLTDMLEKLIEDTRIQSLSISGIPGIALAEHKAILDAMKIKDEKAARKIMKKHLTEAYNISKGKPIKRSK